MASTLEVLALAQVQLALYPPMAAMYQGAATTNVTSGGNIPIGFDTNAFDTYSGHSTVTNNSRYVSQVPAYYFVWGQAVFSGHNDGSYRAAWIAKNGTAVPGSGGSVYAGAQTSTAPSVSAEAPVFLAVGDYVELYATQGSGVTIATNIGGNGATSSLNVLMVHL